MIGGGKYNDICTLVRQTTTAEGVILIVIGGKSGEGFEVQATPRVIERLPSLLRACAGKIEIEAQKINQAIDGN